jgi:carboxypeptidase Q
MKVSMQRKPAIARAALVTLVTAITFMPVAAQQAEKVDLDAVYKIKEEGFQRSKVMEIESWLTDVYGPRLTNSVGFRKAGEWAVKEMTSTSSCSRSDRSAAAGPTTSST